MDKQIIIALVGEGNSGKAWVASRLVQNHGFVALGFTDPIIAMLKTGLGLTDAHFEGAAKGEPLPEFDGATPLKFMQTLGYGWGRKIMGEGTWLAPWLKALPEAGPRVVVPDLRFPNEEAAVRKAGGTLWEIDRPAVMTTDAARRGLQVDHRIINATTIAALCQRADRDLAAYLATREANEIPRRRCAGGA
jgi:hypothetical protein